MYLSRLYLRLSVIRFASRQFRRHPQPGDQSEDSGEHLPRHRDLGHLERDAVAMADNLGADLDQLFAQAGQRPRPCRLRHRHPAHEIAEVVREGVKLQADGVGDRGPA